MAAAARTSLRPAVWRIFNTRQEISSSQNHHPLAIHTIHPLVDDARSAANEWDVYLFHALAGTKSFSKNMESNLIDILAAGFDSAGPRWGVEFGMETMFFYYVLDGEVRHIGKALVSSSGVHAAQLGVAQMFLGLRLVSKSAFPREEALGKAPSRNSRR